MFRSALHWIDAWSQFTKPSASAGLYQQRTQRSTGGSGAVMVATFQLQQGDQVEIRAEREWSLWMTNVRILVGGSGQVDTNYNKDTALSIRSHFRCDL